MKQFLLPSVCISDFSLLKSVLELLHQTPGLPQRDSHPLVVVKIDVLCGEDNGKFLFHYFSDVTLVYIFKFWYL